MKRTAFVYLHCAGAYRPEETTDHRIREYAVFARRFVNTYTAYPPGCPHDLYVVCTNGALTHEIIDIYRPLPFAQFDKYIGGGWDTGAFQFITTRLDPDVDFVVFANSSTHFHRAGWLKRMVDERTARGDGLYGAWGSYEKHPHIRTSFYGCNPIVYANSRPVNNREETLRFEHGSWCMVDWFESRGLKCWMVTHDGCYAKPDWRKPDNIFRRGDQSNCLAWDKHCEAYRDTPDQRRLLESFANGDPGYSDYKA